MEQKFLKERVIVDLVHSCASPVNSLRRLESVAEILGVATGGKWKQGWTLVHLVAHIHVLDLQLVSYRGGALNTTNQSCKQSVKHATA